MENLRTKHVSVLNKLFVSVAYQMGNEDEMKTDRMDREMEAYAAALAAARDNPSDEFLVAAAEARTKFHDLVC